jgi:hypothetical protein
MAAATATNTRYRRSSRARSEISGPHSRTDNHEHPKPRITRTRRTGCGRRPTRFPRKARGTDPSEPARRPAHDQRVRCRNRTGAASTPLSAITTPRQSGWRQSWERDHRRPKTGPAQRHLDCVPRNAPTTAVINGSTQTRVTSTRERTDLPITGPTATPAAVDAPGTSHTSAFGPVAAAAGRPESPKPRAWLR